MNKKIWVLILLLLSVAGAFWAYVLLNGPNEDSRVSFTEFETSGSAPFEPSPVDAEITDVVLEVSPEELRLRQVTTGPVAGAVIANNGIYYVAQGTGHIRHISLSDGRETLLSGTTIPGAYHATFSDDAQSVAITTTQEGSAKTIVGTVPGFGSTGTLDGVALPLNAREIDLATLPGKVRYVLPTENGSVGYVYDIEKQTSLIDFTLPLRDIHVVWGDPTYVYTTPTKNQFGYVYRLVEGQLAYVAPGSGGLMADRLIGQLAVTRRNQEELYTDLYDTDGKVTPLPFVVVPEKCVSGREVIFCAYDFSIQTNKEFPDAWYKGLISFSDMLISGGPESDNLVLSDFLEDSGREIDVLSMGIDTLESYLYFINKNDNTLWIYRL